MRCRKRNLSCCFLKWRPLKGAFDKRDVMEEMIRFLILLILVLQLAVMLRMSWAEFRGEGWQPSPHWLSFFRIAKFIFENNIQKVRRNFWRLKQEFLPQNFSGAFNFHWLRIFLLARFSHSERREGERSRSPLCQFNVRVDPLRCCKHLGLRWMSQPTPSHLKSNTTFAANVSS